MPAVFQHLVDLIHTVGGASAAIALVLEILLRLVPTARKLSLFAPFLRGVAAVIVAAADLLDKVLPQNLK